MGSCVPPAAPDASCAASCFLSILPLVFNGKLSTDDNGHLFYGNVCPTCGAPKTAEYTRTVGFYTKTDAWSSERKEEYKLREWHPLNEKGIEG